MEGKFQIKISIFQLQKIYMINKQQNSVYSYPHKKIHYFLSNFNLFYEYITNYSTDNSITSKELLQSLVDVCFQLNQNFDQYKSESKQLNNTTTNST